jgi:primosomal protein N' (replication factor Y)
MTHHLYGKAKALPRDHFTWGNHKPIRAPLPADQPDLAGKAICHHCGYEVLPPKRCPSCGVGNIRYYGLGTEKLEEELERKFSGIPAARMDADAMKKAGSHTKVFNAFQNGEIRILFGTQMIAKGLDVPAVTLVGVVYADLAMHLPDFRAAERTFQLLAQVAGRAGRGERGGKVLVQTYHPDHPCIRLAARHDYRTFAEAELNARQLHGFPPSGRLARIIFRSKVEKKVREEAQRWCDGMQPYVRHGLRILGPAEAPLKKLEGWYRHHLLVLSGSARLLHESLRAVEKTLVPPGGVEFTIDIDPMNML